MIPEPQIPLAPVIRNSGRQRSSPMILKETSSVSGSIRIRSIAPGAALMPKRICSPLQGGSGGAGGGEEPLAVSHDHLPVRAHIDDEDHLIPAIGLLRDQDPHIVRTHETRFDGEDVDIGGGVDLKTEIARLDIQTAVYGGGERGEAERARIDAEKQVVHYRVSNQGDFKDVGRREAVIPGNGPDEMIQTIDDCPPHRLHAVRMVHHIGDPRNHIIAKSDLGVHERLGADDPAGPETAEISGHGGRAHIDSEAVSLRHLSRKDGEDLPFHPDGSGDRPVPLPESAGKAEEGGIVDLRALQAEPLREGRNEALIISQGILQSGGTRVTTKRRTAGFSEIYFQTPLDDPARPFGLLRHKDQNISPDGCRAGQTDTFRPSFSEESALLFGGRPEVVRMGGNPVLLKVPSDPYPALPAALLSAADGSMPTPRERDASGTIFPSGILPRLPEG